MLLPYTITYSISQELLQIVFIKWVYLRIELGLGDVAILDAIGVLKEVNNAHLLIYIMLTSVNQIR
jgi:hypothetical protein